MMGCSAQTLSNGVATCTTNNLGSGNSSVVASYSGDNNFASSNSSALVETINAADSVSTTTVTSSVNPGVSGQSITYTATVSGTGATPTGTVTFTGNGTQITGCVNVSLNTNGKATCTTSFVATSSPETVQASYSQNLDIFESFYNGSSWIGPVDMGSINRAKPGTSPSVVVVGTTAYVFYEGTDGNLYYTSGPGTGSLGGSNYMGYGPLGSSPSCAINASNLTACYWKGAGIIIFIMPKIILPEHGAEVRSAALLMLIALPVK